MKGISVKAGLLYSLVAYASAQSVSPTDSCYLTTTIIYGDPGTWINYSGITSSSTTSSLQSTLTTTTSAGGGESITFSSSITSTGDPPTTSTSSVISTPSFVASSSVTDIQATSSTTVSPSSSSIIGPPLPTSSPFFVEINLPNPTGLRLRKRDVSYLTFIEGIAYLTSYQNQASVFVLTATSYLLSGGAYVEPSYDQYTQTQGQGPQGPVTPLSLPGPVPLQETLSLAENRYGWSINDGALMLGNASFYVDDIGRVLVFFGGEAELPDNVVSAELGVEEVVDAIVTTTSSSVITDQDSTSTSETTTVTDMFPISETTSGFTSISEMTTTTTTSNGEEETSSSAGSLIPTSSMPPSSSIMTSNPAPSPTTSTTTTTNSPSPQQSSGTGLGTRQTTTGSVSTSSRTTSTSTRSITSTPPIPSSSVTASMSTQTLSPPSSSSPVMSSQPAPPSSSASSTTNASTRSTTVNQGSSSSSASTATLISQSTSISVVLTSSVVVTPTSSPLSTPSTVFSGSRTISSTSAVVSSTSETTSASSSTDYPTPTPSSSTALTSTSLIALTPSSSTVQSLISSISSISSILSVTTLRTTTTTTTTTRSTITSTRTTSSSYSSASSTSSTTPYPAKRGLAYTNVTTLTYYPPPSPYISWSYNYYSLPNSSVDNVGPYPSSQFAFIPLLFNDDPTLTAIWAANVNFSIANYGTDALFGFNEPDACFGGLSSCMSLNRSLQGYATYMQPFAGRRTVSSTAGGGGGGGTNTPTPPGKPIKIGSVAVTNSGQDGLTYLSTFLSNATTMNLTIDFLNLHWYASPYNIDYFKDYMTQAYNVTGRGRYPIWITEFGMDRPDYPTAVVQQFLKNASKWCDETTWVERYAWFGNFRSEGGATNLLLNADGSGLSALGKVWGSYNGTG